MMVCPEPVRLKSGVFVPCGKCGICIQRIRDDYSFILGMELRYATAGHFITLTYADQSLPITKAGLATLDYSDIRPFIGSLRKVNQRKRKNISRDEISRLWAFKSQIKYFLVGEYGTKSQRPHYHGIFFNLKPHTVKELPDIWDKGFVNVGTVTQASIQYCTDYLIQKKQFRDQEDSRQEPKLLVSKDMGKEYIHKTYWSHKNKLTGITYNNGFIKRIPRNMKDKIFNKHEKEMLKLNVQNHLDKEEKKRQNMTETEKMVKTEYINQKLLLKTKHEKL